MISEVDSYLVVYLILVMQALARLLSQLAQFVSKGERKGLVNIVIMKTNEVLVVNFNGSPFALQFFNSYFKYTPCRVFFVLVNICSKYSVTRQQN